MDWEEAHIYPLADWHIGDERSDTTLIYKTIESVQSDNRGLCILNGDIMNTAIRNSVSDVYSETLTPTQQITTMCEIIAPIKDKIIGVTCGNHEERVYRTDGIDMLRLACRELGVEDKYSPEGVLIFLRFGTAGDDNRGPKDKRRQWYSIYATHGSGGGKKEGAKIIRLADLACLVDADVYIHSHTHLPIITKEAYYRINAQQNTVRLVDKLFVNTGAALSYGGYGQAKGFKPASKCTPIITLNASAKYAEATL